MRTIGDVFPTPSERPLMVKITRSYNEGIHLSQNGKQEMQSTLCYFLPVLIKCVSPSLGISLPQQTHEAVPAVWDQSSAPRTLAHLKGPYFAHVLLHICI